MQYGTMNNGWTVNFNRPTDNATHNDTHERRGNTMYRKNTNVKPTINVEHALSADHPMAELIVAIVETNRYTGHVTQRTFDRWANDEMTHDEMLTALQPTNDAALLHGDGDNDGL